MLTTTRDFDDERSNVYCAIAGRLAALPRAELQRLPFGGAVFADLGAMERGQVTQRDVAIVNDHYDKSAVAQLQASREMVKVASFEHVTADFTKSGDIDERPTAESDHLPAFMALKRSALLGLLIPYAVALARDALDEIGC